MTALADAFPYWALGEHPVFARKMALQQLAAPWDLQKTPLFCPARPDERGCTQALEDGRARCPIDAGLASPTLASGRIGPSVDREAAAPAAERSLVRGTEPELCLAASAARRQPTPRIMTRSWVRFATSDIQDIYTGQADQMPSAHRSGTLVRDFTHSGRTLGTRAPQWYSYVHF